MQLIELTKIDISQVDEIAILFAVAITDGCGSRGDKNSRDNNYVRDQGLDQAHP